MVIRTLYSTFFTLHKAVVHINGWQQRCAKRARILSNLHTSIDHTQKWKMRYKGAPLHLPKMMKTHIQSQIRNYEEFLQLITSLQASHAWVFRSMDVVVHAHAIPSIGILTEAKTNGQVRQELDSYFDELMRIATSVDLEISVDTMH